jgi:hypothetical protein
MKITGVRRVAIFLIAVSGIVVGLTWYLFRSETMVLNNQQIDVQYRMGKVYSLSWDRIDDGRVDLKAWVETTEIGSGRHFSMLRVEEDTTGDGSFDRRFVPGPGDQFLAEIDADQDGRYEELLTGDAARELYPLPLGPIY